MRVLKMTPLLMPSTPESCNQMLKTHLKQYNKFYSFCTPRLMKICVEWLRKTMTAI